MSPEDYCRNRVAPPGSALHYSTLFLPPAQRRAVIALHALRRELDESSARREAAIGRLRLDWWRQELDRLAAGTPQHPVSRALAEADIPAAALARHVPELLNGAQMDLDYDTYPGFAELAIYARHSGGALHALCAAALGASQADTLEAAAQLGLGLRLLESLLQVRTLARQGRVYIPLDELQRFGVPPEALQGQATSPALQALFRAQAQRARSQLRNALDRLPPAQRSAQASQIALAEIRLRLLDEVETEGFRLLEHRLRLTPVRKLWIAWRVIRRERLASA